MILLSHEKARPALRFLLEEMEKRGWWTVSKTAINDTETAVVVEATARPNSAKYKADLREVKGTSPPARAR